MVRAVYYGNNGMKKGPWSLDEDARLMAHVRAFGHKNWRLVPIFAGLARCGKSCRLRWVNYLRPGLRRGSFTQQEEDLIIQLHAQLGNKWAVMASKLPGRTDHEIKNHWHAQLKKRIAPNSNNQQYPTADANKDVPFSPTCFTNQVDHGEQLNKDLGGCLQDSSNLVLNDPTYSNSDSAAPMFLTFPPSCLNPMEQAKNPTDAMGLQVGKGDFYQVINFESTGFDGYSSDNCWITSSPEPEPQLHTCLLSVSPDQSNYSWGIHISSTTAAHHHHQMNGLYFKNPENNVDEISNNIIQQLNSSDFLTFVDDYEQYDQTLHSAYAFGEDELLYNVVHWQPLHEQLCDLV